ncbi:hypothetical protein RHGRI_016815 [Rhododendron griersonianum]|uniref:Uncharacterized protein n=1 Tax=Rhododendron griersonianum TaxID=479676 RepID=A0AAV6JVQ7_9ERIC|nr:hypothetical protein RHGRI_016815 [Rhododendron griersonianum]
MAAILILRLSSVCGSAVSAAALLSVMAAAVLAAQVWMFLEQFSSDVGLLYLSCGWLSNSAHKIEVQQN